MSGPSRQKQKSQTCCTCCVRVFPGWAPEQPLPLLIELPNVQRCSAIKHVSLATPKINTQINDNIWSCFSSYFSTLYKDVSKLQTRARTHTQLRAGKQYFSWGWCDSSTFPCLVSLRIQINSQTTTIQQLCDLLLKTNQLHFCEAPCIRKKGCQYSGCF